MSGFQKIVVVGNLGSDAELRRAGETPVLSFSVAANETWKDRSGEKREHTEWFKCELWGTRAEALAQYLTKGKTVAIDGTLRTESYEKDGEKRWITKLRVGDLKLMGGGEKREGAPAGNGGGSWGGSRYGSSGHGGSAKHTGTPEADSFGGGDDDIPFLRDMTLSGSWGRP